MVKFVLKIKENNGHMEFFGNISRQKSTTEKEMLNAISVSTMLFNQIDAELADTKEESI